VGLDPDLERLPAHSCAADPDGIVRFCKAIIDATADLACAFKPQIAYFAALAPRPAGEICRYLRTLSAHSADPRRQARRHRRHRHQYAREAFDRYGADAVTVSPYMGFDSVEPYMAWRTAA
jgi:orotidine-5'-phosphate decarboxylase